MAPAVSASPVVERLAAQVGAGSEDQALLAAVRATRPAVVTVWNLQRVRDRDQIRLAPVSTGSGVIFDQRGYVATNAHVLEGAEAVQVVFLDGRRADGHAGELRPGV